MFCITRVRRLIPIKFLQSGHKFVLNTLFTAQRFVSNSSAPTTRLLTKSYVNTYTETTSSTNAQLRRVYPIWDQARKDGKVSEFVNLQTEERTTSTEILDQADKYAAGLLSLGLEQGVDCISMFGCLSNRTLSVWAGCLSIGVGSAHPNIFIPREKTIETAMGVAKPKVIFVGDACDGEIVTALASHFAKEKTTPTSLTLPSVERVFYEGSNTDILRSYPFMQTLEDLIKSGETISEVQLQKARDDVKEDDATHIVFTSGSTGPPKCAQLDQRCMANIAHNKTLPGPVALVGGFNGDVAAAFTTTTVSLACNLEKTVFGPDKPDKEFGQICGDAIMKEKVNNLMLLATKLEAVSEYIEKHHQGKHEITLAVMFGQIYTRKFRERIQRALGNAFVMTVYGMSECPVIGHSPYLPSEFEDLMNGKLIAPANVEIRIVNGGEIVDIGEEGEVEAKATLTFKGYRGEPEKTKQLFTEDRFVKTGDTAVMYPDGKFMIRGRASDAIRFKVERKVVWPAPIEEALSTHPNIHQIKVISSGLSDTVGDEIVYCIRLEKGAEELTSDSVIEYCKLRGLTQLQFPRRVLYFDFLPVTVNDRKIDSRKLREEVLRRLENQPDLGKIQFNLDY